MLELRAAEPIDGPRPAALIWADVAAAGHLVREIGEELVNVMSAGKAG
jgi:hypothetical protein